MPRQVRQASATGIYHVMLRGINRQDIFEDSEDYNKKYERNVKMRLTEMSGTVNPMDIQRSVMELCTGQSGSLRMK